LRHRHGAAGEIPRHERSIALPRCRIIRHNSRHATFYSLSSSQGHRTPANESAKPISRSRAIQPHVHSNASRHSSLPRSFDQRLGQISELAAHRRRGGGHNRFHRNAHDRGARAHTRWDQDEIGEGARDGGGQYLRDGTLRAPGRLHAAWWHRSAPTDGWRERDICWQRKGRDWKVTPGLTFASGLVFFSSSHGAVIRVYDEAGNVIETHEHAGEFKEPWVFPRIMSARDSGSFARLPARARLTLQVAPQRATRWIRATFLGS